MSQRDELFQRLADVLSEDIAEEMIASDFSPEFMVDQLVPKGSPGSQFHRPVLIAQLQRLREDDEPLDLVTCLQIIETFGWAVGLI